MVAYLCWLLAPLTGLHLLYLGRNRAALLSSVSCGHFGVGWLCDAFRIPGYATELTCAEAACAAGAAAGRGRPPNSAGDAGRAATERSAPGVLQRLRTLCTQLLLGLWFFYHASRLLPPTISAHAVSYVSGAVAAVAVWLSASGRVSAWATSVWALLPVLGCGLASCASSVLFHVQWPDAASAAIEPHLRLKPALLPLIVGVSFANLVAPRCRAPPVSNRHLTLLAAALRRPQRAPSRHHTRTTRSLHFNPPRWWLMGRDDCPLATPLSF